MARKKKESPPQAPAPEPTSRVLEQLGADADQYAQPPPVPPEMTEGFKPVRENLTQAAQAGFNVQPEFIPSPAGPTEQTNTAPCPVSSVPHTVEMISVREPTDEETARLREKFEQQLNGAPPSPPVLIPQKEDYRGSKFGGHMEMVPEPPAYTPGTSPSWPPPARPEHNARSHDTDKNFEGLMSLAFHQKCPQTIVGRLQSWNLDHALAEQAYKQGMTLRDVFELRQEYGPLFFRVLNDVLGRLRPARTLPPNTHSELKIK